MARGDLKGAGSIKIDGITYQLVRERDQGGFFWHYSSHAPSPTTVTPEEEVLSPGTLSVRTAGWLDWSMGGVGPSAYQPNVRWLSWSEGPQTEYTHRIYQPLALQDLSYPMVGRRFAYEVNEILTSLPDGYYPIYKLGTTTLDMWRTISYQRLGGLYTGDPLTPASTTYVPVVTNGGEFTGVPPTIIEFSLGWAAPPAAPTGGVHSNSVGGSATEWGTGELAISAQNELSGAPDIFERAKGDIVGFAQSPDGVVFTIQEGGDVRRIVFSQGSESAPIRVVMADKPSTTVTATTSAFGSRDGFSLPAGVVTLTEGSEAWTVVGGGAGVAGTFLLLGAEVGSNGTGGGMFKYRDGVWVQAPDTISRSRWASGIYSEGPLLWGATSKDAGGETGLFNLKYRQDPFTLANWTTDLFEVGGVNTSFTGRRVGSHGTGRVTAIAVLRDGVIVAVDDGMFYRIPSSGDLTGIAIPIIDPKSAIPFAGSGKTMGVWSGILFIPTARGLFRYEEFGGKDGGTLVGAGPEFIPGNQSPIRGSAILYTGDPEFLLAAFYNGSDSYIMKGRMVREGETANGSMVWHSACPYLRGERVTAITVVPPQVSNVSNPLLMVASTATSGRKHLRFCVLPRVGKTFLSDGVCPASVVTSGRYAATLPDHDVMMPATYKNFLAIRIVTKAVSHDSSLSLHYRLDEGEWVFAQRIITSPVTVVPLPINTMGYKIGVRLTFNGADPSKFASVEAVSFDFVASVRPIRSANVQVYVAREQATYSGQSRAGVANRLGHLELLKDEARTFEVIGPDNIATHAQIDSATGINWRAVEQVDQDAPGTQGFVASFKLNLNSTYTAHTSALYDGASTYYTEGGHVSYYEEDVS